MSKDEPKEQDSQEEPPKPREAGTDSPPLNESEDKAIDEIEAANSRDALDDLYEHESEPEGPMLIIGDEKHPHLARFKRPMFWIKVFFALVVVLIFVWLITPSRIWLLNTVGLRTQVNIATLVSAAEGAPPMLKNATATVNGHVYHTDDKGTLRLALPYGFVHIVISKQGYESVTKDETLDFDPFFGKIGGQAADKDMRNLSFPLKNVGIVVSLAAKDWLTGQPITAGTFSIGDVAAQPTADGEVILTLPALDGKTAPLVAKFSGGYADTTVDLPLTNTKQEITFIPAGKDYFLSKRSGQFAVYSANLDGSGVAEVVPGSPNETGDITFTPSPSGKYGILASTREATHDNFGSVQQKLYLVDTASNKLTPLDTALTFTLDDWSGNTLVYTASYRDSSGATVARLGSLDAAAAKQVNLANAPGFKVVRVRLGSTVYLSSNDELHSIKIKGGTEKSLGTGIARLTQTEADKFAYQTADHTWHQYDVNSDQLTTVATPASIDRAFLVNASIDGQSQMVLDTIDGKLTLLAKNIGSGKEVTLDVGANLTGPIHWVGNVAVYRAGSADYVVSPAGGDPKKITDVTPTFYATHDYTQFN